MKIAILSDIHGIWPALTAVIDHIDRWAPDQVIVNGDIVNRGPYSGRCWDTLQERAKQDGWQLLRGNHEAYVLAQAAAADDARDAYGYPRLSGWTCARLGTRVEQIAALPDSTIVTAPDRRELHIFHGSRRHSRDGISRRADADTIRAQIAPAPAAFATAHIHLPSVWQFEGTCMINSGSVGTPADGDERASYAQATWSARHGWQAEIARVPYERAAADRDFHRSGFLLQGNPFARLVYHEWRLAQPVIPPWSRQFHDAVATGKVSLNWTVDEFLSVNFPRSKNGYDPAGGE